jgi:peptide/nickel transport system substrate-binding protein
VGDDYHVAPVHPEHADLPPLKQDYAKAKRLLAEAGHPNGLKLRIDCVANPTWEQNTCKAIAEMVKPAGIDLEINIMPGGTYWDRWLSTPFGFTSWTHRALGVQVLNLAYRSGVAWNETSYNNPEFDKLLDEAGGLADVNERRKVMAKVQKVLQDDAVIAQTFWRSVFVARNTRVKNIYAQVAFEHHYNKAWLA